jgi:O-antigen/teichoic acid export membrane protein
MTRRLISTVILLILAGAATALCLFLLMQTPAPLNRGVRLDESLPVAFVGGAVAAVAGQCVAQGWHSRRRMRRAVTILTPAWLCASVAAMFGWHIGNSDWNRSETRGMAYGAAGGALFGLMLGWQQWRKDRMLGVPPRTDETA